MIGGIDLGLEWAGMECLWQVENDDYCNEVLAKRWPDVERFGDVRQVGKENLAPVDLIAGGFPCQPHSVAGKRRGAEDDRNLWPEFSRIIDELQPRYVLAENVPGIITTYIDEVLSDLENKGYTCGTFNIPAVSLDAPHRRERIFIVGYTSELGRDEAPDERPRKDRKPKGSTRGSGVDSGVKDVANSASEGGGREGKRRKAGRSKTERSTGGSGGSSAGSGGILADSERERLGRGAATGRGDRRRGKRTKAGSQSLQPGDGEAHAGELESGGEAVVDSEGGENQQREPRNVGETPEGREGVNASARDGGPDVADSEQSRLEGYTGDGAGWNEPGREQEEPNGPIGAGGVREVMAYPEGYLWRASGDARPITFDWRGPNQTETLYLAYTWGDRYIYCYWSEAIQNWQEIGVPIPHSKHTYWLPEPNVGRVVDGISSELDGTLNRFGYEHSDNSKAFAEIDFFRGEILRVMWCEENEIEPPPYSTERIGSNDFVYQVSHLRTHERWNLGKWIEKDEELRGMWNRICAEPFEETQDLQREMLERIRATERDEKVASKRVDRLRGLGNAVVPQVAEWVGLRIMEFDTSRKA